MAKETIMIVEDEEDILELIKYNLEKENYSTIGIETGEACLEKVKVFRPDLILLDLMLPGIDGLRVCRVLKNDSETARIPVVMLTAKGEESDIVTGLEMGADDYLTKPFSHKVLIARIRSVLRRLEESSTDKDSSCIVKRGDLTINPGRREVTLKGTQVVLTYSEFEILQLLVKRPGWVYTRNQIVNQVKGDDYPVTERSIDVQIVGLRRKMGSYGKNIETIRGVGYRYRDSETD